LPKLSALALHDALPIYFSSDGPIGRPLAGVNGHRPVPRFRVGIGPAGGEMLSPNAVPGGAWAPAGTDAGSARARPQRAPGGPLRSEEHTSELQSRENLV